MAGLRFQGILSRQVLPTPLENRAFPKIVLSHIKSTQARWWPLPRSVPASGLSKAVAWLRRWERPSEHLPTHPKIPFWPVAFPLWEGVGQNPYHARMETPLLPGCGLAGTASRRGRGTRARVAPERRQMKTGGAPSRRGAWDTPEPDPGWVVQGKPLGPPGAALEPRPGSATYPDGVARFSPVPAILRLLPLGPAADFLLSNDPWLLLMPAKHK